MATQIQLAVCAALSALDYDAVPDDSGKVGGDQCFQGSENSVKRAELLRGKNITVGSDGEVVINSEANAS